MKRARITSIWRNGTSGDWYETTSLLPCANGEKVTVTERGRLLLGTDPPEPEQEDAKSSEDELRARVRERYPDVDVEF